MARGKLSERRQRFVDEYLKDANATQAYLRAGYRASEEGARRCASLLLTNVDIASAIAAGQKVLREQAGVTQQMVIDGLKREAELCGEDSSHSARVSAWSTLAKVLGMMTERREIVNPDGSLRPVVVQVVGVGPRRSD
jgi:phage terminase small subunit